MKLKLLKKLTLATIFLSGCSTSNNVTVDQNTTKSIFDEFKTYSKINNDLILSKPHMGKYVFTYINSTGIDSFKNKKFPFSDGTIVVKQSFKDNSTANPDNIYVMKKIKDYDKENGDWFYAVLDSSGKSMDSGKIQMCINCHKTGKDKDYVFGFNQ